MLGQWESPKALIGKAVGKTIIADRSTTENRPIYDRKTERRYAAWGTSDTD